MIDLLPLLRIIPLFHAVDNIQKGRSSSFIDNVFRDDVTPVVGSVLVCDLTPFADHSGIYIGNGKIVHRSGNGYLEVVSPAAFLDRLDGLNTAISIYVACRNHSPIGSKSIARRAEKALSDHDFLGYDLLNKNCHHFTRYCLTGNTDMWGLDFTFTSLEALLESDFGLNNWRVWKYRDAQAC